MDQCECELEYFGYQQNKNSNNNHIEMINKTKKSKHFMRSRNKKVEDKINLKIQNASINIHNKNLFTSLTSQDIECYFKFQNVNAQINYAEALCVTSISVLSFLSCIYTSKVATKFPRVFLNSVVLHPRILPLYPFGLLLYNLLCSIESRRTQYVYNVLQPLDDPEEANLELNRLNTIRRERQLSKEALSKHKFDPQAYH